ncbi:MAG: hypothetical protein VX589_07425, partial [Myxococcota bacterium]|nr:hypothetical protein [Myxococcota bacterium]
EFETRKVRNLENNVAGKATDVAKKFVDECRAAFKTPERWAAFRQDLRLFRSHMGKDWWQKMFKDHGFNASPVWSMLGVTIANNFLATPPPPDALVNSPANLKGKNAKARKAINKRFKEDKREFEHRIGSFALFDAGCYVTLFLLIWWAFGLWGLAFSILVFGVGYPWAYFWTGGSFGRAPWLLMSVAGVCLFKRGFPLLGGFGITWAMLLRVFPGALIFGVSIKMAWSLLTKRRLSRTHVRIIVGCTLGMVVLVGSSMAYFGGTQVYQDFLTNSFKHNDTKLTNHMGLPTLISYHPSYIARKARDNSKKDPFKKWKDMRRKLKKDRLWLHALLLLSFIGMLGYIGRRMHDWEVTALSTVFIVGIFELTCYYYSFLLLMALVAARRASYAIAMIAMVVGGQIIRLTHGWYDEQYTWETLLVVLAQIFIMVGLCIETYLADKKDALAAAQSSPPPTVGGPDAEGNEDIPAETSELEGESRPMPSDEGEQNSETGDEDDAAPVDPGLQPA